MKYNPLAVLVMFGVYVLAWLRTPPVCEGDRWADRAIYSDDPAVDPLARP